MTSRAGGFAHGRRWLVAPLVALLTSAANAAAPIADPCPPSSIATPPQDFVALRERFVEHVRRDPTAAIAIACDERSAAKRRDDRWQARIDLGHALGNASRDDESVAVLDAVIAELRTSREAGARVVAEAFLRRGNAYGSQRRMKEAGADFAMAGARLRMAGDTANALFAEMLLGRSSVLHSQLDLDGAKRAVDEADQLYRRLGMDRTREAADVLNQRTMIAYARQDFPQTIRLARAEIELVRSIGGPDDRELLDALATLGAVESMTGDFAGAEAALREGLRIADALPDASLDARLGILQNLAALHLDRVEPAAALPIARRALQEAIDHYGVDAVAVMREQLTVANVETELGHYLQARDAYASAAAIDARHGDSVPLLQRLRLRLARSQLDVKLGDPDAARDGLVAARTLMGDRPKLGYWRGWEARLSCRLAAQRADWAAADRLCANAIAAYSEALAPEHVLILESFIGRCYAQARGDLPGDACRTVDGRLQRDDVANAKVRVLGYEALAARETTEGHGEAAFDLYIRTLAAAEEIDSPDPLWAAQYSLAVALADRGDRRLAIVFGRRAIASIDRMRVELDADRQRLERGFLSNKLDVYRHVADWLLAEARPTEAIDVLHMLKREEQFDYSERAASDERAAPFGTRQGVAMQSIERREDPFGSSLQLGLDPSAELERLSRLREAGKLSADDAARLGQLLSKTRENERRRVVEIRRLIGESRAAMAPDARGIPDAQATNGMQDSAIVRSAGTDQADAYFVVVDSRLHLLLTWDGRQVDRVMPVDVATLDRTIARYVVAVTAREDVSLNPDAAALYALLGAPLDREARQLGIKRIRLWVDGALRYVPFAALWDGQGYLVERYEFSYLYATSPQPRPDGRPPSGLPEAGTSGALGLVAFGVTQAVGGQPALPGVAEELCSIVDGPVSGLRGESAACSPAGQGSGTFAGKAFANDFFTEERFRSVASRPGIPGLDTAAFGRADYVHVGTHFYLRPGNIDRSWLLLGDGNHLSLESIRRMNLSGVDLVTLSACQTGIGGAANDDGREVESLPDILHKRGVRVVVASLWRIDDRGAGALMRDFYASLRKPGTRVAEALRNAQLAMLRDPRAGRARPYYWAAFVTSAAR